MKADYGDTLLCALLSGAISFKDPRVDLGCFTPESLLNQMNTGNDAVDRAVASHLIGRLATMTSEQVAWLWHEIRQYRSKTFDASLNSGLNEIETKLREELQRTQSHDNCDFVYVCSDVISWIPPLRSEAERLLREHADRIDSHDTLCSVCFAYGDAEVDLPQWFKDRASALLDDNSLLATENLERFAAAIPCAKSLAVEAYRKRIADLDIKALLNRGELEVEDFRDAWHHEILKPSRKTEIAKLLVELGRPQKEPAEQRHQQ